MKMKVGLETVVAYFPETIMKAKDYSYLKPFVPEMIRETFRGPDEIRRFKNDDAAEILAEKVAKKALDRAGLKPSDIDYIIASNVGGKFTVPMIGCSVHHKLGFPQETPVLNIANACASFVDGCELAWNLINAGKYKRILLIQVSAMETSGGLGRIDQTDFLEIVIGDGAGAAIVSSQNLKCEFLSYYNRTWSETYEMVAIGPRPAMHPELEQAKDQPAVGNYLLDATEYFQWWQQMGPRFGIDGINGALMRANLTLDDLDMVLFHQIMNMHFDIWIEGAAKAGLSKDKWKHTWDNMEIWPWPISRLIWPNFGKTVSSRRIQSWRGSLLGEGAMHLL